MPWLILNGGGILLFYGNGKEISQPLPVASAQFGLYTEASDVGMGGASQVQINHTTCRGEHNPNTCRRMGYLETLRLSSALPDNTHKTYNSNAYLKFCRQSPGYLSNKNTWSTLSVPRVTQCLTKQIKFIYVEFNILAFTWILAQNVPHGCYISLRGIHRYHG